ncbi:unnamed protein product [Arabis nemorensis]|uniref:Uncharacterized protein n=1 Tax=Arabis nemorensis TaxID=586526 RepID=A0A565CF15_9BRAS|nr:unnamed protein product [Arabis nemorensis]
MKEIKNVLIEVQDGMVKMNQTMEERFQKISSMFGGYETRLKTVESFVNYQGWNDRDDFGFDDYHPRSRFWTDGDCSGGCRRQNDLLEKDPKTGLEKDPSEKDPCEKDPLEKDPKDPLENDPNTGLEKDPSDKDPESGVEKETQAEAELEKEVEKLEKEAEATEVGKEPEAA